MGWLVPFWIFILFSGCEDQINPELADAPPIFVVDAWINDKPEPQIIKLATTQPYFNQTEPPAITDASVVITDDEGNAFQFDHQGNGSYEWVPQTGQTFGDIGRQYELAITTGNKTYTALSKMNRVPAIDSVTFRFEEENFILPDSFWAEFWSRDPEGAGDTYWIKSYKNGQLLNKPDEINIAYDAGFNEGGNIDGIVFIPPIRDAINPFEEENDEFLSPFNDGDSVYVELYSITNEAFIFLNQTALQINRPGGFGELFATPLSNVPTNILSSDPDERVVGFFNVSAVSMNGKRLDESKVPRDWKYGTTKNLVEVEDKIVTS